MHNYVVYILLLALSHPIYALTTLAFGTWTDDFSVDEPGKPASKDSEPAYDGWSSDTRTLGTDSQQSYHGLFARDNEGHSTLYRYFDIPYMGKLTFSFTFVWACDIETSDYWTVTYGTTTSPSQRWNAQIDPTVTDNDIMTEQCTKTPIPSHGWQQRFTFTDVITDIANPYILSFDSSFSSVDELWAVTDISLTFECLNPKQMTHTYTKESLETYLGIVGNRPCATSIQNEINALIANEYSISIDSADSEESESNSVNVQRISFEDFEAFVGDAMDQTDIDIISEIFDEKLDDLFLEYSSDMSAEDLDIFCPKLEEIYSNIAGMQWRILIAQNPNSGDNAVLVEKINFGSYTNRIKSDSGKDGFLEIEIKDSVVKIPYSLINQGRTDWNAQNMDSIDVTVLVMDNVFIDDCNGQTQTDTPVTILGDFAMNIDIFVDDTSESKTPFLFSVPFTDTITQKVCAWIENVGDEWSTQGCDTHILDNAIECECDHQTVFNLIEDLRTDKAQNMTDAKALQIANIYLGFLVVYSVLALAATYLVITLYRIRDIKSLASVIICVITLQIYSHVIQYIYLSFAPLDTVPIGVTFCIISIPLLCHFWVCSLLILHWMKIFECAMTFNSNNKSLDYAVYAMNVTISIVFIALLIAAVLVPQSHLSMIISASNGVLGIVGISICILWFYFGFKTSTILMKSANTVKDSCADALDEALTLRKRLLGLTFIIGFSFFTQSVIAILSIVEHLQLFSKHFINFASVWAVCDIIIFLTFILFYKTHVLRQKEMYEMEQRERELERAKKRKKRDGSTTTHKSDKSKTINSTEPSQSFGFIKKIGHRISIFTHDSIKTKEFVRNSSESNTKVSRKTSVTAHKSHKKKQSYQLPAIASIEQEIKSKKNKKKSLDSHLPIFPMSPNQSCETPNSFEITSPNSIEIPEMRDRFSVASNSTVSTHSRDDSLMGLKKRNYKKHSYDASLSVKKHNKGRSRSMERSRHSSLSTRSKSHERSPRTPKSPSVDKVKYGKRKEVKAIKSYTPKMTSARMKNANAKTKKKLSKTVSKHGKAKTTKKVNSKKKKSKSAKANSEKKRMKNSKKKAKVNKSKKSEAKYDDNDTDNEIAKIMHKSTSSNASNLSLTNMLSKDKKSKNKKSKQQKTKNSSNKSGKTKKKKNKRNK